MSKMKRQIITSLVDEKALAKSMKEKQERELVKEVASLKNQLVEAQAASEMTKDFDNEEIDVVLKVKPEKAELIKAEMIDNQKYILIPIEEDEQLSVNGIEKDI